MKLAIISFARKRSKRLPKKNTMLLNGKPLIWYTLEIMDYLVKTSFGSTKAFVLTDDKKCKKICEKSGMEIEIIWRDHPKEWDDNRLNQWAHEKIQADAYILLQPTSPFRDKVLIDTWSYISSRYYKSAFSVTKQSDLTFKRNGLFFYYTKEQLATGKLVDENSLIFQGFDIDIDTIEDFKKAEEYAKQNNYGVLL